MMLFRCPIARMHRSSAFPHISLHTQGSCLPRKWSVLLLHFHPNALSCLFWVVRKFRRKCRCSRNFLIPQITFSSAERLPTIFLKLRGMRSDDRFMMRQNLLDSRRFLPISALLFLPMSSLTLRRGQRGGRGG